MGKLAKMAMVGESLRDAREEVNSFVATTRDPDARALMAASVSSHLTAMRRLFNQLCAPLPPQEPDFTEKPNARAKARPKN
jgi:hypothetical protein